jgi:hypothetical protein
MFIGESIKKTDPRKTETKSHMNLQRAGLGEHQLFWEINIIYPRLEGEDGAEQFDSFCNINALTHVIADPDGVRATCASTPTMKRQGKA